MFNPPMAESTQKYLSVHNFKVLLQDVFNVDFPTGYRVARGLMVDLVARPPTIEAFNKSS